MGVLTLGGCSAAAEEGGADDLHRVGVKRVNVAASRVPYVILINQPLDPIEDELDLLRRILYYTVPFALLLAGLGGWLLARKSLAPVVDMAERARRRRSAPAATRRRPPGSRPCRRPDRSPRGRAGRPASAGCAPGTPRGPGPAPRRRTPRVRAPSL